MHACDYNMVLGVNVDNLAKVMQTWASNTDIFTISADAKTDSYELMFEEPSQDRIASVSLKQMEIDAERLGIPTVLFSCVVELLSSEWQKLLEQCQQVTDTIRIEVKKDAISFVYGGGKIEQRANADEDHKLAIVQHDCDVSVSFAMRHLILFTKATPLARTVRVSLGAETPILVEYSIEALGFLRYYLAPKMEEPTF